MKKSSIALVVIIIVILLMGCSKEQKELIYDNYTAEYSQVEYSSYVDSKEVKQYNINDKDILMVSTGDCVNENQVLFNITNNEETVQKVKNNNQINNINSDINLYKNKLSLVISDIQAIDNKLYNIEDEGEKQILNEQKQTLNNSKEEINRSILELQRNLDDINIDIQYQSSKDCEIAPYDGQVIISNGILSLYSRDIQIVYSASQDQVSKFSYDKSYEVHLDNKNIGSANVKYIIPDDEATTKGVNSYYKVVFQIETQKELLRNNVVKIIDKNKDIYIPKDYVREGNGKFYVKINGQEIEVVLEKVKSTYKVISGINNNDILQSYIGREE